VIAYTNEHSCSVDQVEWSFLLLFTSKPEHELDATLTTFESVVCETLNYWSDRRETDRRQTDI